MDSIVDTLFNSISLSFSLDFKDPSSLNFSNQVHMPPLSIQYKLVNIHNDNELNLTCSEELNAYFLKKNSQRHQILDPIMHFYHSMIGKDIMHVNVVDQIMLVVIVQC